MDQNLFFFQALVYLGAAVIFVPIAKKIGLGSVLGYLLAGVIVGPFVLGLVGKEGTDVMHFAEFGVVMMLFLIGLELEPALLWKMRRSIVGLGGLQIMVTTIIIGLIAFAFHFTWQQSLVLGMVFSLSSTAIVLQSLSEKGLMQTASGQSSFAVLLFQDIAVIPMLAIFPLLADKTIVTTVVEENHTTRWIDGHPGWLQTVIVLGSIVSIIVVGRILIRPALRFIAKLGTHEVFTAAALLIIVGIAALMTKVGLSPALGSFLAGVVLANSEYKHELESDVEPFKGLFLGVFFIAVGASINFHVVRDQLWSILGWVLLLLIVKTGVLLILGKLFKISSEQNFIFSFSLSQVGEFAFVLFSFTMQEGILPAETANIMTTVVAISMMLTPLVNVVNEKLILPRVGTEEKDQRPDDEIDEHNPVIIAGFGSFGSTVGRFLRANGVAATYLDLDSDRVDLLRKMGVKVFYGDPSRYELLRAAGAAEAKIILIAMDSAEKRLSIIDTVKKHFPHLHMLVRASNRYDAYDLMNAGMLHVYRETLDTSLKMGVDTMTMLGYRAYTAMRLARTFIRHDERNMKKLASIRNESEYIVEARKYIEELELIIQSDNQYRSADTEAGWDPESVREEVRMVGDLSA